jgi:hypothetical protein
MGGNAHDQGENIAEAPATAPEPATPETPATDAPDSPAETNTPAPSEGEGQA